MSMADSVTPESVFFFLYTILSSNIKLGMYLLYLYILIKILIRLCFQDIVPLCKTSWETISKVRYLYTFFNKLPTGCEAKKLIFYMFGLHSFGHSEGFELQPTNNRLQKIFEPTKLLLLNK